MTRFALEGSDHAAVDSTLVLKLGAAVEAQRHWRGFAGRRRFGQLSAARNKAPTVGEDDAAHLMVRQPQPNKAPAAVPPPPPYPNRKLYRNRVLGRFFGEYLILLSMSVLVLIVNMLLKRKEVHWWFSAPASKPLRSWLDLGGS